MSRKLRVGLVGAGYIAPFHLAGWQAQGAAATVVALADPNLELARARAGAFGVPGVFPSAEAMCDAADLDVLDIASPRQLHTDHLDLAARYRLDAICQKPLAPTLAEATAAAERIGSTIRVMVHENWRFRPEYQQARLWIDKGYLGDVRFAHIAMRSTAMLADASGSRPVEARQPFLLSEKRLLVAEVLIHTIDALRFLVGDLTLTQCGAWRTQADVPGETAATLVLETMNGSPVLISGDMTAFGTPPRATDAFELTGDAGRITLEADTLAIHGRHAAVLELAGRDRLQESASAAIAHFVACLASGAAFQTDIRDNLKTLAIVEDVYRRTRGPAFT